MPKYAKWLPVAGILYLVIAKPREGEDAYRG